MDRWTDGQTKEKYIKYQKMSVHLSVCPFLKDQGRIFSQFILIMSVHLSICPFLKDRKDLNDLREKTTLVFLRMDRWTGRHKKNILSYQKMSVHLSVCHDRHEYSKLRKNLS